MKVGYWMFNIALGLILGTYYYIYGDWNFTGWFSVFVNLLVGFILYYYDVYCVEKEKKKQKTLADYVRVP